jgi:hypothetical protein
MARFDFDLSCKQWPTSGHNRGDVNVPRKGDGYLAEKWRNLWCSLRLGGERTPFPKRTRDGIEARPIQRCLRGLIPAASRIFLALLPIGS